MSQINVDIIRSRTGTAATCDKGLVVSGVTTATSFAGALTGDVTGNVTGNVSGSSGSCTGNAAGLTGTPAITVGNVTSTNVTNSKQITSEHVNVTGISTLGGDVSIADKIVHTGDTDTAIRFSGADTITAETGGSERLRIDSSGRVLINTTTAGEATSDTLTIKTLSNHAGVTIRSSTSGNGCIYFADGTAGNAQYRGFAEYVHSSDLLKFGTAGSERLRITSTGGLSLNNGELVERCYINSTAWSTTGTVNLDNGMVQYNSANLAGTTNTLDIISGAGINTTMTTGDMMSVTCITAVNAATAYINNITIDGLAATETWVGGSAPTDGGTAGVDTYAFNIIKTAANTYTVIANQVKTS